MIENLTIGLMAAATPTNLLYCFLGCLAGTLIGVLPGLGPATTIAMLLPVTAYLEPTTALIMLAGIYYGAQYGGSTTAILVNLPGEASSAVTAIDGYKLARQGRAGYALATAALASLFAGIVATLVIAWAGPLLARSALAFGAPEYFSLMVLGLVASVVLSQGSLVKALCMVIVGLLLGSVGTDVTSGVSRLTFGFLELEDGVNFVAVAMGLFGIGEILSNMQNGGPARSVAGSVGRFRMSLADLKKIVAPTLRGTALGAVLGVLPGGGAILSSFVAYAVETRVAKDRSKFGQGAIEGVAAPEAANNAGAQTSFIPMLTLGIPSNVMMALMASALIMQGIQPGPNVMLSRPDLFWGLIVSMFIGNVMLVMLNLPLINVWVRLLSTPYKFLFPLVVIFCCIGVLTINNRSFDVFLMAGFGVLGYVFRRLDCDAAPLLLGMILGSMMEEYLLRALLVSRGDPMVFLQRPLSATLLIVAFVAVVAIAFPALRSRKDKALQE